MNGGFFNYKEYVLDEVSSTLKNIIEENGKPIPYEELDYFDRQSQSQKKYEQNPRYRANHNDEILERFRTGLEIIKSATSFVHDLGYLLSGDIGEETFLKRTEGLANGCSDKNEANLQSLIMLIDTPDERDEIVARTRRYLQFQWPRCHFINVFYNKFKYWLHVDIDQFRSMTDDIYDRTGTKQLTELEASILVDVHRELQGAVYSIIRSNDI